jgi:hypothetical protein
VPRYKNEQRPVRTSLGDRFLGWVCGCALAVVGLVLVGITSGVLLGRERSGRDALIVVPIALIGLSVPVGMAAARKCTRLRREVFDYERGACLARQRCPACDYALRGTEIPRCPECGETFSDAEWTALLTRRAVRDGQPR